MNLIQEKSYKCNNNFIEFNVKLNIDLESILKPRSSLPFLSHYSKKIKLSGKKKKKTKKEQFYKDLLKNVFHVRNKNSI